MDGWNNARIYLLRTVLTTSAALVSVTALHAEMLTSPALPIPSAEASATQGFVPLTQRSVVRSNAARESAGAWLRAFGTRLTEFRRELVTELVATQLTMIGGHPMPPVTVTSAPPTTPPVTVTSTPPVTPPPLTPPVPTGNPPPPPPPPPPPGPPIPTGGGQPPDPTPPPPPDSPEPASLVLGLLGAGLASLTAWRRRNAAQRAG